MRQRDITCADLLAAVLRFLSNMAGERDDVLLGGG
jgi:hypothetical protein